MKNHKAAAFMANMTAILILLFGLVQPVIASSVSLQQPTATFSQSSFGDFSVAKAINGTTVDNLGWAIELDPFVNITSQTAVFETVTDVGFGAGSVITFSLSQTFPNPGPFTLGRFRFSVTTDNRSLFADGLASGGDVTANWTILNPTTFHSANGATLSKLGDLSILASGPAPHTDLYTISAPTSLTRITGVRLEVLEDPSLPFGGPGRHPDHGSFVLSELQMDIVAAQSNCVAPAAGLVSWWRGENNAVDGVGINHGILQNGAGFGSGLVGQALSFDGISNYVTIPASASLNLGSGGGLTIECWIKPAELSVARPLVEYSDGVSDGVQLWISQPWVANQGGPGSVFANIVDTSGGTHALISAPGILTTNQFHHVAVTYDQASGLGQLYADGVVVFAANLGTFTPRTSSNLLLGLRPAGSPNPSIYSGLMDEVSIYSRALATNEIQAIYNAGSSGKCQPTPPTNCAPAPSGLVGWWRAEGDATDVQGPGVGSLFNGAGYAGGKVGQAFNFPGSGAHVAVPDRPGFHLTNALTVEAWIYPTAHGEYHSVISKWDVVFGPNQKSYSLAVHPDGRFYLGLCGDGNDAVTGAAFSTNALALNQWSYICGTYDGTAIRVYLNGEYQSQTDYGGGIFPGTNALGIGGLIGGGAPGQVLYSFAGRIDEPSLYSRALSQTEIQGIYAAGLAGKCLTVTAPYIISQPASQIVPIGSDVIFHVTAGGTAPLSYQWSFNGTNLAGATTSSLTKTNVQLDNAGNYAVVVSNSVGTVTSSNAVLTVNAIPSVTLLNVNFAANQVKTGFAATGLTGSDFWNDLWFPFQPSAGLSGLKRADGTATATGLTVQNGAGHTGFSHPDLMYQSCCYAQDFGDITLTVTNLPAGEYDFYLYGHAGDSTANTVFQLLVGGNDFGNQSTATDSSWSLTNWVERAQYVVYRGVTVTNGGAPVIVKCHPGVSGYTYLNGLQIMAAGPTPPVIVSQAASQSVLVGADVSFSVTAGGTAPLSYQWQFFGTNLPGATTSILTITNVQLSQAGAYALVVSNSVGTTTSSNAVLTVNPTPQCVPPASGLVSWWPAEGDANDSLGGNHGALVGGVAFGAAKVGQGFSFNDSSAHVSIAANSTLNVGAGSGLTIEAWIRPASATESMPVMEWNSGSGGNPYGVHLWTSVGSAGNLFANIVDTAGNYHGVQTGPGLLTANAFQHVALSYDKATGQGKLYLNGQPVALENLGTFTPQTGYNCYLGFRPAGGVARYAGAMDEVSLYSRALSDAEIQAIYNAGSAGKCSTPAPPVVFTQPTNQTVSAGASVTFAVAAGGSPPLSYQWSFNSQWLMSATNASLTLTNVSQNQAGIYSVRVTNLFGATVSSNAYLTVQVFPPSLILQPTNQIKVAGETATLLATASGTAPLSYQWTFNGETMYGATNALLVFPNVSTNWAGVYAVTVRNFFGSATSSNATLAVVFLSTNLFDDFEPGIDLPQWSGFGGSVQATNHGGFVSPSNSLWFGGTGSRFATTRSINTTNSWDLRFHLRFANGFSPLWDRPELPADGVVLEYSTNAGVNWSEFGRYNTLTFATWTSVTAFIPASAKVPAARFRWRQLANSGSISDHWALDDVLLTEVAGPPRIVDQPQSQTVNAGGTAVFLADADGSPALHYQWRVGGTDIPGATNRSLTLSNVQPSQAGNYSLHVANVAGVAVSSNAVLKVTVVSALGNGQLLTGPVHYFSSSISVELTNHFPGGLIFYTLDGSAPSFASSQYLGPLQVSQTVVLRAIGYRADFLESGELGLITILKVPGFTLSVSSAGGGSVTLAPPGGDYSSNTVVSLTAVPDTGWTFLKWLGDADGSSSSTNVTVTRNKSVQAVFGTTLNTTAAGGGSVALNPPGGLYAFGSAVQITAIPNAGNYFGIWGSAASGNVNPLLFTVTNPNPTVSSIFGAVGSGQAALTVVPVGRGQVSINPRANVYPTNSAVTITATPDAGQSFIGWGGDASGTQNPLQLTLDSSKLIYANFTRRPQVTGEMLLNEGFRLSLIGDGVATYRLEMSTNLTGWETLAEITNAVGKAQFIDLAATNSIQRFYRALILP